MRAYKIVPWEQVRAVSLSRKAQERLVWIDMINKHCGMFNYKYNFKRYHQAIGYRRPAEYVSILQEKERRKCYGI